MFMPRPPKAPPRTFESNGFWHWKPSARLREEGGFRTTSLGQDMRAAFAQARLLNTRADAWLKDAGTARPKKATASAAQPGSYTFGQLAALYRASHAFTSLRASTQKTYGLCLAILEREFAHERIATLTRGRVRDWADPLRTSAPQGLRHYAAMAHNVVQWAMDGELVTLDRNPFDKIKVGINRRKQRILEDDLKWLVAFVDKKGRTDLGTAMVLSFFLVQRIWDVLPLTKENVKGGGFKLRQSKTKAEIVIPTLPQPVAQRLKAHPPLGGFLCARTANDMHGEGARTLTQESAYTAFARLLVKALKAAREEEGLDSPRAARLKGLQLRDMRRSGFVFYAQGKKDSEGCIIRHPVPVSSICSMSGHAIEEGMAIVETYLPKTPEQADMAVAMANAKW